MSNIKAEPQPQPSSPPISNPPLASPFLHTTPLTTPNTLAILHLRRDQSIATLLSSHDAANEGYSEGKVTNTRFGSFPHSTLLGLRWGSQVRASAVDTGSRGRKAGSGKRKREDGATTTPTTTTTTSSDPSTPADSAPKAAKAADSGFIHILPPTPEIWTMSLPHRTQVVYTPDYSLILQRLRALPGTQLIEAGAGSGSFSHAAARAVFSGYPDPDDLVRGRRRGKVWSFEFHEKRCQTLQREVREHALEGIVEVNHRDVYEDGFGVSGRDGSQKVRATAVFLDLPAPWLALGYLRRGAKRVRKVGEERAKADETVAKVETGETEEANAEMNGTQEESDGPLAKELPVRICCFLPCIEQVQRTVTTLKSLSWQEVSVVEVAAKRIEVRRERIGIKEEGLRGVNATPANVEEALIKLREAEERTRAFHEASSGSKKKKADQDAKQADDDEIPDQMDVDGSPKAKSRSKQDRLQEIKEQSERRKLYKEGRLVHRPEAELKTHTSYLVFAVLPREWTEEDEARARAKWSSAK